MIIQELLESKEIHRFDGEAGYFIIYEKVLKRQVLSQNNVWIERYNETEEFIKVLKGNAVTGSMVLVNKYLLEQNTRNSLIREIICTFKDELNRRPANQP